MNNSALIPVAYLGHKERKIDNVAGSGVVWHGHGDVQPVTVPQWGLLSKYPQIWARAEAQVDTTLTPVASAASLVLGDAATTGEQTNAQPLSTGTETATAEKTAGDNPLLQALYGTDVLPSQIEINGQLVQLGTVVASAQAASGLSVEDWNGLVPQIRDQLLIEHLEVMRGGKPSGALAPQDQAATPTGDAGHSDANANGDAANAGSADSAATATAAPARRQRRQAAAPTGEVS